MRLVEFDFHQGVVSQRNMPSGRINTSIFYINFIRRNVPKIAVMFFAIAIPTSWHKISDVFKPGLFIRIM